MSAKNKRQWKPVAVDPPVFSRNQWLLSSVIGAIFVITALLQIIDFQTFSNNLTAMGIGGASAWGGVLIFTELWAAAGFFKLRLSWLFRLLSNILAVAVSGFWFYETLRQVSEATSYGVYASGKFNPMVTNFFGKYLTQTPGWWPVIEATLFLLVVVYLVDLSRRQLGGRLPAVTKVTRRSGKKEV